MQTDQNVQPVRRVPQRIVSIHRLKEKQFLRLWLWPDALQTSRCTRCRLYRTIRATQRLMARVRARLGDYVPLDPRPVYSMEDFPSLSGFR